MTVRARPAQSAAVAPTAQTEPGLVPATMNIAQAAVYLGISKATLYTWRTRRPGFGPRAVKAGGALRYRRTDLDTWIDEHAETPVVDMAVGSDGPGDSGSVTPRLAEPSLSRRSRPRYLHPRRPSER